MDTTEKITEELSEEISEEIIEQKKTRPWVWIVVSVLVVLLLAFFISEDLDKVREVIAGSGVFGILIAIILYGLLGASPIPSEPLTVLLSTIFGPFTATLAAGAGNLLAAVIEYFLGAKIGDAASFMQQREKLPFGLGRFPIDSPIFLIGARMLPGYGPKLVSIFGGLYHVPMWRYIWTTAIPTFLGAAIFAYGGSGLFSLRGH